MEKRAYRFREFCEKRNVRHPEKTARTRLFEKEIRSRGSGVRPRTTWC